MAPRPSWSGHLRLSLVTLPVQAINAENPEGEIHLQQLHSKCHNRIQYRKVCPEHGEVPADEIVYGYEREPGEYAVLTKEESRRRQSGQTRAIDIDSFIDPKLLDESYYDGSTYYLLPDGKLADKPYAVLRAAIAERGRIGIGVGQFWGKQRLIAVFSTGEYLGMRMLKFARQLRDPAEVLVDLPSASASKEEVKLAEKLIDATTTKSLDLERYEDTANALLQEIIDSKTPRRAGGTKKGTGVADRSPPVINLMDALRKSVAKTPGKRKRTTVGKRRQTRRTAS